MPARKPLPRPYACPGFAPMGQRRCASWRWVPQGLARGLKAGLEPSLRMPVGSPHEAAADPPVAGVARDRVPERLDDSPVVGGEVLARRLS